ncbi:DNA-directed RNA polymerase III subunit RPC3 [Geranomyces variabilis]|nr:DNA-directed RNA polymerase III subunit RPC3 [Geranomyces variabilis]
MSGEKDRLAKAILLEHFGPIVQKVAGGLLERGRSTLVVLVRRLELSAKQVRESLFILIQHNMVTYAESAEGSRMVVYYQININAILLRDRFSLYMRAVRQKCGEESQRMFTEILRHGRANYPLLAANAQGPGMTRDQIADAFKALLDARVVVECRPQDSVTPEDQLMSEEAAEVARRGGLPLTATEMTKLRRELALKRDQYDDGVETGSKRKVVLDLEEITNKKVALNEDPEQDPDKYYRANFAKLHILLRNEAIARLAERRMNAGAGEVVRKLLSASEHKMRDCGAESKSEPVSQIMLSSILDPNIPLPVDGRPPGFSGTLDYLESLMQDDLKLVTKESEGGGGQFSVNLKQASIELKARMMESVVQEKFGDAARRIWRILLLMQKLNETQVNKFALVPLKTARHCLYAMHNAGLAFIQDVPKTLDHSAARTFFLWYVSIPKSTTQLAQSAYHALANLKRRRATEIEARALLIEKMNRTDIIEGDAQLSESEAAAVENLNRVVDQLIGSEIRMAEMLMVLEEF